MEVVQLGEWGKVDPVVVEILSEVEEEGMHQIFDEGRDMVKDTVGSLVEVDSMAHVGRPLAGGRHNRTADVGKEVGWLEA